MGLAESAFHPVLDLNVELETDPETDEKGLVVEVRVSMAIQEVLRRKRAYTRQWIDAAPADVRSRIRLFYDII